MVPRKIIVLVERAAHAIPDHVALTRWRLCGRLGGQSLEQGLERFQSFPSKRLCHQGDQTVELAVIVGADPCEDPLGQPGRSQCRMSGDRAEILQGGGDDVADRPVAVITPLVDRWRHLQQPPEEIKGLSGFGRCHMIHDCRPLHVEILGQRPDLSPVDKGF